MSRLEWPSSLSLSSSGTCSSPLIIFADLHWTLSSRSLSLELGAQHWTQHSRCSLTRAEQRGRITPPGPAGHAPPHVPQDPMGLLAPRAHRWLMGNLLCTRAPRSFSAELPSSRSAPACAGAWVVPPQVQDPTLASAELHQVPPHPTPQPVQVSLDGIAAFWSVSHSSRLCIICRLAGGALCAFIQVMDE